MIAAVHGGAISVVGGLGLGGLGGLGGGVGLEGGIGLGGHGIAVAKQVVVDVVVSSPNNCSLYM